MENSVLTPKGELALRILVMPSDLNAHGTLFGGAMMSYLDQAGAIVAAQHIKAPLVLKAVNGINFKTPCFKSERLSFYGRVVKVGKTSITVDMDVYREHMRHDAPIHAATATYVFVQVGKDLEPEEIQNKEVPTYE